MGPLIWLTFVLTLDDHRGFHKSRQIGSYLGLRTKQRDSGESQPLLRITKVGDRYWRSLLIQGAPYLLGKFGLDTDLKRWGLKLAGRGGKNAQKRAVVAVARKLA
ncbi:MAG: IS110 family transposase, partial [Acidobacteriia bacterium]|nr:IS110 family transposase [Terriglobia bacterium]